MPGEFKLTGPIWKLVADSADEGTEQDLQGLVGATGVLTSNIPINQPVPEGDGIFFVEPRAFIVDEDGDISDPVTGEKGISLLADDPGLELTSPVQWRISMNSITMGSRTVKPRPWWFNAPSPGDDKTLGELTPVPGVMHDGGTRGPRGYGITGDFKGETDSEAEMLALTGVVGDWTARQDTGSIWVVTGSPTSSVDNWLELDYPTVSSIEAEDIVDASASGYTVVTGTPAQGRAALQTDSYHLSVRYVPASNGTDDTAAVQAVFAEGPGIVVFRKGGTWFIDPNESTGMIEPQSNTTVIIEAGATVRVKTNALGQYRLFELNNVENVTITGSGTLLGDSATHTGSTGHHGHLINITNGSRNCRVIGPLLLKQAWGDGIFVGGTAVSYDTVIDGVVIEDCRREGIGVFWADGCEIRNCRIFDISLTEFEPTGCPGYGIGIEPNADQIVNNVTVENCYTHDCAGNGITALGHFGTVTNVIIRDNRVVDCAHNSGATAGTPHGIRVKNVDDAQIIDNTIVGTGWEGTNSVAGLTVNLCNRPVVRGGTYSAARGPGIWVDTCVDANVGGAYVYNNLRRGILVTSSDNVTVRNNDLIDNCVDDDATTAHVHVTDSDLVTIKDNTFRSADGGAWVAILSPSANCSVTGNIGVGTAPPSMLSNSGTNTRRSLNFRIDTGVYEAWDVTGSTPVGTIELGHASDTTLARSAAGRATIEGAEVITSTAAAAVSAKTSPVDADLFIYFDSEASNAPKRWTWANLKTTLASWLGLLPSGTAVAIHNQADQTNNWERLRAFFSSNVAQLMTEQGGTGTFRDLRVGVANTHYTGYSISNPKVHHVAAATGTAGAIMQATQSGLAGASVAQTGFKFAPTVNQSGTSSYIGIEIAVTETATGSGTKKPLSITVGGVEKFSIDNAGTVTLPDAANIVAGTTTGTKIGTTTSQKLGFWNATPIVQPTTAVASATFAANTSGIVNDTATFDGYTIGQVVKALRNAGLLA